MNVPSRPQKGATVFAYQVTDPGAVRGGGIR